MESRTMPLLSSQTFQLPYLFDYLNLSSIYPFFCVRPISKEIKKKFMMFVQVMSKLYNHMGK